MYEKKIIDNYKGCGLGIAMEVIGGKHKPCIISSINKGLKRPSELHKEHSSISRRVLNQQLSELEQYGIVEKTIFPVLPPKVEYNLTENGKSLLPVIKQLEQWGESYEPVFHQVKEKKTKTTLIEEQL